MRGCEWTGRGGALQDVDMDSREMKRCLDEPDTLAEAGCAACGGGGSVRRGQLFAELARTAVVDRGARLTRESVNGLDLRRD